MLPNYHGRKSVGVNHMLLPPFLPFCCKRNSENLGVARLLQLCNSALYFAPYRKMTKSQPRVWEIYTLIGDPDCYASVLLPRCWMNTNQYHFISHFLGPRLFQFIQLGRCQRSKKGASGLKLKLIDSINVCMECGIQNACKRI